MTWLLAKARCACAERYCGNCSAGLRVESVPTTRANPSVSMASDSPIHFPQRDPLADAEVAVQRTDSPPQIPDHELLRRLGRGSYGEVWLGRNVVGTCRAVKVVYRERFENERPYEREYSGIKKFEPVSRTHEGLVDILQIGRNDTDGYFYYVMELADDANDQVSCFE